MGRRKVTLQEYVHLVGSIGLSCANSEERIDDAIRQLSLSIDGSRVQFILNEINSVKTKIKIVRKMSKKALSPTQFKRYNNILGKLEFIFDKRNQYAHGSWFFKAKKSGDSSNRPFSRRYKRDSDNSHIPIEEQIRFSELKRHESRTIKWGLKLKNFNEKIIHPSISRKLDAHIRKQSNHLKKNFEKDS